MSELEGFLMLSTCHVVRQGVVINERDNKMSKIYLPSLNTYLTKHMDSEEHRDAIVLT